MAQNDGVPKAGAPKTVAVQGPTIGPASPRYIEPEVLKAPRGKKVGWPAALSFGIRRSLHGSIDDNLRHAIVGTGRITDQSLSNAMQAAKSSDGSYDPNEANKILAWLKVAPLDPAAQGTRAQFQRELELRGQLKGTLEDLPRQGAKTAALTDHFVGVFKKSTEVIKPSFGADEVSAAFQVARGTNGKVGEIEKSQLATWLGRVDLTSAGKKRLEQLMRQP